MLGTFVMFFFFNDTATTEIYTLSLHDALPILGAGARVASARSSFEAFSVLRVSFFRRTETVRKEDSRRRGQSDLDRKSTRLNSSHSQISNAVSCLKNKS